MCVQSIWGVFSCLVVESVWWIRPRWAHFIFQSTCKLRLQPANWGYLGNLIFHYSFEKKKVCKCQIHCIWPGFSFRPHFLSPCPAFLTVLVKQIQNCSIRGRLTESMYWLPFLTAVFHGLDTLTVMGIAFAAFVIGALLTGALWYIYSHTGECDRRVLAGVWPVCAPHSRHFRVSLHGWVDGITTNKRERSFPQFAHGRNWHQLGFAKI